MLRPRPRSTLFPYTTLFRSLRAAAAKLAPGWLGAPLDATPPSAPLPTAKTRAEAGFVRVGSAQPLDDARFPVIRSEERRVGKECRSGWWQSSPEKKCRRCGE